MKTVSVSIRFPLDESEPTTTQQEYADKIMYYVSSMVVHSIKVNKNDFLKYNAVSVEINVEN